MNNKFKGSRWGLRQLVTTESSLKMTKNAFNFMVNALFVLKTFIFLSLLFGYVDRRLDKKAKVTCRIYDVREWIRNNYNTHLSQYLKK